MYAKISKIVSAPTKYSKDGEIQTPAQAKVELTIDLDGKMEREGVKNLHDALHSGDIALFIQVLPPHFNPHSKGKGFPLIDDKGQFFIQYIKEQLKQIDFVDNDNAENPLYIDKQGNLVDEKGERIYAGEVHPHTGGRVFKVDDANSDEQNDVHSDHLLNPDPETSDRSELPAAAPKG